MEKIDIVLLAIGGGFALSFAAMRMMWSDINKRMDDRFAKVDQQFEKVDQQFEKVDQKFEKVDQRFDKVDQRFEKLESKVEDIDRRLCRIEGGLASSSYCVLKDHGHKKKHHG